MAVFAVITDDSRSPKLASRIKAAIKPTDALQLPSGLWLVSHDGTSRALADALGLGDPPETGSGIVMAIGSYWGRQDKNVWEWLAQKQK